MSQEAYWTCDWVGCTEAVPLGDDRTKEWHHGNYDYGEEERNDDFDLCPAHGQQLANLLGV